MEGFSFWPTYVGYDWQADFRLEWVKVRIALQRFAKDGFLHFGVSTQGVCSGWAERQEHA